MTKNFFKLPFGYFACSVAFSTILNWLFYAVFTIPLFTAALISSICSIIFHIGLTVCLFKFPFNRQFKFLTTGYSMGWDLMYVLLGSFVYKLSGISLFTSDPKKLIDAYSMFLTLPFWTLFFVLAITGLMIFGISYCFTHVCNKIGMWILKRQKIHEETGESIFKMRHQIVGIGIVIILLILLNVCAHLDVKYKDKLMNASYSTETNSDLEDPRAAADLLIRVANSKLEDKE